MTFMVTTWCVCGLAGVAAVARAGNAMSVCASAGDWLAVCSVCPKLLAAINAIVAMMPAVSSAAGLTLRFWFIAFLLWLVCSLKLKLSDPDRFWAYLRE